MNVHVKKLAEELENTSDLLAPEQVGGIMKQYLPTILSDDSLLTASQRQYNAELEYTKHVVYSSDLWSLQALVWRPNAKTSIHNHKCWCTLGVYQGEIIEERFRNVNGTVAECYETVVHKKGVFGTLIPDGKDIHRILNTSEEVAISLHFYGINAFADPSSVLNEFETTTTA